MKLNLFYSNQHLDDLYFTGKTTVVIDVLRATTVIVTALANGAREIIPVSTVDFAMKVSGNAFSGQTLLGGERNTKKVEGFSLGNSPLEYTTEVVNGKSIILYTTNGSKAIVKAKFSENLYVCSFLNLPAIAANVNALNKDVEIICAGSNGSFNLEDAVCAGRLVSEIQKINEQAEISDSCKAALVLNKAFGKNINKMLKETEHGKLLIENGFGNDLKFCAQLGVSDLIPYFISGTIKKLETINSQSDLLNDTNVS